MDRALEAIFASSSFTWRIDNFSKVVSNAASKDSGKFSSKPFEFAGYSWRILLFPGTKSPGQLSLYLDLPEAAAKMPSRKLPKVRFRLQVIDQRKSYKRYSKETTHQFSQANNDWGYTTFLPLEELAKPTNGWLVNDSLLLAVELHVEQEPILITSELQLEALTI